MLGIKCDHEVKPGVYCKRFAKYTKFRAYWCWQHLPDTDPSIIPDNLKGPGKEIVVKCQN